MSLRDVGWRRVLPAVALAAAATAGAGCRKAQTKPVETRPAEVVVGRPVEEEITDYEEFTGRSEAKRTVQVRARVTGYLDAFHFEDGGQVKEGDLLFEIDPRPYKAALDKVEAALKVAQARERLTEIAYGRFAELFRRGQASRDEFDKATDDFAEARANVGVAEAEREAADLNMKFTRVKAQFTGRIGRHMVDPGNLVKADDTVLTSIVLLDPIYIYFDIDERTLLRLRRLVRQGKIQARTEAEVPVLVALADEKDFPRRGKVDFSDNAVNPTTGTLQVRGVVDNPAPHVLSPGMFVRVRLPIGRPHRAILVDEKAVGTDQGRKYLYVVNDDDEVVYRQVEVGALSGSRRVITEGLKPGERVVVNGLQRVRPGAKVNPKEAEPAAAETAAAETAAPPAGG